MTFEVIDCKERLAGGKRQRLAGDRTDDQSADQTGSGCGGDGVDLGEFNARLAIATMSSRHSVCARAAISGTTPPYSLC